MTSSNCSVFQFIDLSSLRQQWETTDPETQITLNLSARFRREAAATDAKLPKLAGSCRIYLFNMKPEANSDGVLSKQEFVTFLGSTAHLDTFFKRADKDGSGDLSVADLASYIDSVLR
ncbi:MAG: hypothetical protein ABJZ55_11330 [Fuerstiella sp.]